jgi:molecular chaperone GrpE
VFEEGKDDGIDLEEGDIENVYDGKDIGPDTDAGGGDEAGEETGREDEKYLRLYAEFENFKKIARKEKEEVLRFANESIIYELLPSLDNLEIALKHADSDASDGLLQGVDATLRELNRTLEKFGLKPIEALGDAFDPAYHHAISQVERDDVEENTVVDEFRKGYLYMGKVLRASMVVVSSKPSAEKTAEGEMEEEKSGEKEEI